MRASRGTRVVFHRGGAAAVILVAALGVYCAGGGAEMKAPVWEVAGSAEDVRERFHLYASACEAGVTAPGCHAMILAFDGRKELADAETGSTLLKLAALYDEGKTVTKNRGLALAFLLRSCTTGNAEACGKLSGFYPEITGVAADAAAGLALFDKGCSDGNQDGCGVLGHIKTHGLLGLPRDGAAGAALQQKACDAGKADACLDLAASYNAGRGVNADKDKAIQLASKACASGLQDGCVLQAGVLFEKGGKADYVKAKELYTKACEAGSPAGCTYTGGMIILRKGEGGGFSVSVGNSHVTRSQPFFQKGCDLGHPEGCVTVVNLLIGDDLQWEHLTDDQEEERMNKLTETLKGLSVENRQKVVDLADKACKGANPHGCAQGAVLLLFYGWKLGSSKTLFGFEVSASKSEKEKAATYKVKTEDFWHRGCVLSDWAWTACYKGGDSTGNEAFRVSKTTRRKWNPRF